MPGVDMGILGYQQGQKRDFSPRTTYDSEFVTAVTAMGNKQQNGLAIHTTTVLTLITQHGLTEAACSAAGDKRGPVCRPDVNKNYGISLAASKRASHVFSSANARSKTSLLLN